MSVKDISYLELWQPLCLVELNQLCNFDRRHHEENFFEIILDLDQWFRRCFLKTFFYLGPLERSGTICAILVESIMGNIHVKLF